LKLETSIPTRFTFPRKKKLTALLRFLASFNKVSLEKGKENNLMRERERGKLQQLATASCGCMIPTRFIRQTVVTVKK